MFFDTDCGGVVHNLAYLRMIEAARTRLMAELGLPLAEMVETREYPTVIRTEIDYRRPARLGDLLRIHGELERLERARFWVRFRVCRGQPEESLITCRQQLALVRMPEGKPLRIPEKWKRDYGSLFDREKKTCQDETGLDFLG
jgi:YbgC/YbaW family acyl-CoA thioester hydrolase